MDKWKLHTVDGTGDILPDQCAVKYEVEDRVLGVFRRFGYRAVETPVLQFYDSFEDSRIPEETMFKFFDREGRIVVLRPDITTPIARICATKLADGPQRLCYSGKVFRYRRGQHEFTQAGVELYGVSGAQADAEVIACGVESLLAAGLEEFQLELGQAEFFKGLAEQCGLDEQQTAQLAGYIDKKDALAVSEWLRRRDIPETARVLIERLPACFGGLEVLDGIDRASLCARSRDALAYLEEVYRLLESYGFSRYISIDLSQVGELDYYTGVTFKGFTYGLGFAICGGGRYDGLTGSFGRAVPAVGLGIDTDRLLAAMSRQDVKVEAQPPDVLVVGGNNHTATYNVVTALRGQDMVAEHYILGGGFEDAVAYAKARGIGGIAKVDNEGGVTMHDLTEHEKTEG